MFNVHWLYCFLSGLQWETESEIAAVLSCVQPRSSLCVETHIDHETSIALLKTPLIVK